MKELVFLGGTSGNNNWRDHFISILVSKGITASGSVTIITFVVILKITPHPKS